MSSNKSPDDNLPSVSNDQEIQSNQDARKCQDTRRNKDFSSEHDVSDVQNNEPVNDTHQKRPRTEGQCDSDPKEPQVKRKKTSLGEKPETQATTDSRLASPITVNILPPSSTNVDNRSKPSTGNNNSSRSPVRTISRPQSSINIVSRPTLSITVNSSSSSSINVDDRFQSSTGTYNDVSPRSTKRSRSPSPLEIKLTFEKTFKTTKCKMS